MKRAYLIISLCLFVPIIALGGDKGVSTPQVVATSPAKEAKDVDPNLTKIEITFSEAMMDKSWSWSYENAATFPRMTGEPYYTHNRTRCVLPVKLEPRKDYVIWINTAKFQNFRSQRGVPVQPYRFTFRTR